MGLNLLPPLFFLHVVVQAVAIGAVALPLFDAVARKRATSWLVALVVFYAVAYGVYGIEELLFREVWPSFIPFIALGAGVGIAVAYRIVLVFVDRQPAKPRRVGEKA